MTSFCQWMRDWAEVDLPDNHQAVSDTCYFHWTWPWLEDWLHSLTLDLPHCKFLCADLNWARLTLASICGASLLALLRWSGMDPGSLVNPQFFQLCCHICMSHMAPCHPESSWPSPFSITIILLWVLPVWNKESTLRTTPKTHYPSV